MPSRRHPRQQDGRQSRQGSREPSEASCVSRRLDRQAPERQDRERYNGPVNAHRLAEERSLALHRAVADRLIEDPSVLHSARDRVQRWLETGQVHAFWAQEWQSLLSRPVEEIRAALLDSGEHARALRQVTPFAGAIDPRTRWRIWRRVRSDLETTA